RWLAAAARQRIATFALAAGVVMLLVWAGYRFSFGPVSFASMRLPAPELFAGIQQVQQHDAKGHLSYFLGDMRYTGWWYYYPVVLAVKTPLGFLLLLGAGFVLARRKSGFAKRVRLPLAFAGGILLVGMASRINIGSRHVLPVYAAFSLVAAAGAAEFLRGASTANWVRFGVLLAGLWFAASSALSHPDYLAYFNKLAGNHPENIVVDSDLDWGQDAKRLGQRLRELGAPYVRFAGFVNARFDDLGFPPVYAVRADAPTPGWNAISVSNLKLIRLGLYAQQREMQLWPEQMQPEERVGKTIYLYYVPVPAGVRLPGR
ncbi:MAG: glycosyl transferase, partial [Acidobacteriia bacterium]|nr:glycosyl transferase [Terriglobia bacterium]